jgi:uncharacterized metal-binding protein YceD (DUF177 family)
MKNTKEYIILFKGLKLGTHLFEYHIDKKFFDLFTYDEYLSTDIKVDLTLIKKQTLLDLNFKISGIVSVNCDVTGEEFNQPINGELNLIVKYGEKYNNENEEILILPHNEFELDTSQYIYEVIILSTPTKKIHPGVLDGTLKSEILNKLEEYKINKKETTDPRWDKLKELINKKS